MADLSGLGARSLSVWTRRQAGALLTPGEIASLVRTGVWQVVWRGVYSDGGFVLDAEQRAVGAVLAAGGTLDPVPHPVTGEPQLRAAACGRTAARVWGFPLIDDADPSTGAEEYLLDDVAVARRVATARSGRRTLRPHEVRLGVSDLVRRPSGLWVTSPLRTLVDCARLLSVEALVCATDAALHRHQVTLAGLAAGAAAGEGRPGAPALRRAVELADLRSESPAETLTRLLLLPVIPTLVPQVELFDSASRLVARFDLADQAVRFAVEADGKRGHAGTAMVARDRRRDRSTGRWGWATERVTWFELRRQQAALVQRVLEEYESQARRRGR